MDFSHVTVLGPGLLGGSLLKALSEFSPKPLIHAWAHRPETVARVAQSGCAQLATTDLAAAVADADLIILATPVGAMPKLAESMREHLRPDALVTDVGSVKAGLSQSIPAALHGAATYIGSHPMAGSEQAGFSASSATLFQGATCIVTPMPAIDPVLVRKLSAFWEMLGMRTQIRTPQAHDELVAEVSHLPHLVASALVAHAAATPENGLSCTGPGWRDTTRVASGSPELWTEILATNRHAVSNAAVAFAARLLEAARYIREGDTERVQAFLTRAKQDRERRLDS